MEPQGERLLLSTLLHFLAQMKVGRGSSRFCEAELSAEHKQLTNILLPTLERTYDNFVIPMIIGSCDLTSGVDRNALQRFKTRLVQICVEHLSPASSPNSGSEAIMTSSLRAWLRNGSGLPTSAMGPGSSLRSIFSTHIRSTAHPHSRSAPASRETRGIFGTVGSKLS